MRQRTARNRSIKRQRWTVSGEPTVRSEELLAKFARTGDEAAFSRLVERHWTTAYRLAVACLRRTDAAEDVAQEVFLRIARRTGKSLELKGTFDPWFRALVYNVLRNQERGRRRREAREDTVRAITPTSTKDTPEDDQVRGEIRERVYELPIDVRYPVVLHYYEGLAHREVADAVGCPVGTASSRIRRGLEQLKESLVGAGYASVAPTALVGLLRHSQPPAVVPPAPDAAELLGSTADAAKRLGPLAKVLLLCLPLVLAGLTLSLLWGSEDEVSTGSKAGADLAATSSEDLEPREPTSADASDSRIRPASDEQPTLEEDADNTPDVQPEPTAPSDPKPSAGTIAIRLRLVDDLGDPLPEGVSVRAEATEYEVGKMWTFTIGDGDEATGVLDSTGQCTLDLTAGEYYALHVKNPHAARGVLAYEYQNGPSGSFRISADSRGHSFRVSPEDHKEFKRFLPEEWWIAPNYPRGELVLADQPKQVQRVVPRLARLNGVVTGVAPGASVRERATVSGSTALVNLSTRRTVAVDEHGRFFTLLHPGKVTVVASAPGRKRFERELVAEAGQLIELEIELQAPDQRLFGRVLDEQGRQVAGAKLTLGGSVVTSAPDGSFELWLTQDGEASLALEAPGYLNAEVKVPAFEGAAMEFNPTLSKGSRISIRITNEQGAGLSQAKVLLRSKEAGKIPALKHLNVLRVGRAEGRLVHNPGGRGKWLGTSAMGVGDVKVWTARGEADAEGWVSLDRVPPGDYLVLLEHRDPGVWLYLAQKTDGAVDRYDGELVTLSAGEAHTVVLTDDRKH